jgi:GNAT superfamily N-acetyltransferase
MRGERAVDESWVRVRHALASDAADLAVLLDQLGYPVAAEVLSRRIVRFNEDPSSTLFAAVTTDGAVVGLAALHILQVIERDESSARLIAFVVRDEMRGRGIGRSLLDRVEAAARDAGCDRLHVTSGDERSGAHAAYRRLGFTDTGRRFAKRLAPADSPCDHRRRSPTPSGRSIA